MSLINYLLSLTALPIALLITSGVCLLMLFLWRWRYDGLAAKYAAWQCEGQAVEKATHAAVSGTPENTNPPYPFISIVVPAHNQAHQLATLLPLLFEQRYEGNYEVIVADEISEDDTVDLMKQQMAVHPALRMTYVPRTSRQIELRKLAITLGIKAARGEWVVVVNPDTHPQTDLWLQHYAQNLDAALNMVEAYYNYGDNGSRKARRAIMERVRAFNMRLSAFEAGIVLGSETANYAVRRSWFLAQGGFADSLLLPFGEESLFAHFHAETDHTLLLCSADTKLIEELPSRHELNFRRVAVAETLHRMTGRATWYRYREVLLSFALYLALFAIIFYAALRIASDVLASAYNLSLLWGDLLCLLFIVLTLTLPIALLRRSLRALSERKYGIYIWLFDALQPLRRMRVKWHRFLLRRTFKRNAVGMHQA